jgi:para-nitrobenzyl esterase
MLNSLKSAEDTGVQYQESRGVHSLAELRALPWEKLMTPDSASVEGARRVFQPVIDGWVIPQSYNEPAASTAHVDATFIVGNNLGEGGVRSEVAAAQQRGQGPDPRGRAEPKLTLAAYLDWAKQKFGDRTDEFLKLYPASSDDDVVRQNNAVIRDYARVATYLWSSPWLKPGSKPIFTYFWTHAPPSRTGQAGSAGHGSEINYAFNNLYATDLPWTDDDRRIADIMSWYWVNIARNGDPNGPGLPTWPALDPNSPMVMELGEHFGPIPITSPDKLAFWKRLYQTQNQTQDAR